MNEMSRDDLVREFGEPGVENPNVVDLVTSGPGDDRVTLVIVERRPWSGQLQLRQLEEKLNRYLGYVLDGFLAQQYPQYADRKVTLRLDCAVEPSGEAAELLAAARQAVEDHGLAFEVAVGQSPTR